MVATCMRSVSLVLVVASVACYREAAPPPPLRSLITIASSMYKGFGVKP
jgi:hypothetical protein